MQSSAPLLARSVRALALRRGSALFSTVSSPRALLLSPQRASALRARDARCHDEQNDSKQRANPSGIAPMAAMIAMAAMAGMTAAAMRRRKAAAATTAECAGEEEVGDEKGGRHREGDGERRKFAKEA